MRRKIVCIIILIFLFVLFLIFLHPKEKEYYVREVISPTEFILDNGEIFKVKGLESFDPYFSSRNKELASKLNLSEEDAFVTGNLGKYWARNILEGRKINIYGSEIIYHKFNYRSIFMNSPYCIKDGRFVNSKASEKVIKTVKRTNYRILNLETDKVYPISPDFIPENYIVIKGGYKKKKKKKHTEKKTEHATTIELKDFKLLLTDFTQKLKPDRKCSSNICKEILSNINQAQSSIDIAIYGYSSVPAIEQAIKNAQQRGVKIRLVHDMDSKGNNIYENTSNLAKLIQNTQSDRNSKEASFIMHNKFYIFDNKTVITGSANLSHTDMSGYNSNAVVVINSEEAANIYRREFEQMYEGRFHSVKTSMNKTSNIYFSPQDKTITNGVLPLIKGAKNYIYIPAFIVIENRIIEELISAKKRGIDVRIIADALNASAGHSRVKDLRENGVPVKIENYAGKMHSKTMIIDDKYLLLGSMNFSYSGENRNDENFIILANPEAAKFYKSFFLYLWDKIPDKWLKYYPKAEGLDSVGSCSDGIDNDYDGLIDSADEGCATHVDKWSVDNCLSTSLFHNARSTSKYAT